MRQFCGVILSRDMRLWERIKDWSYYFYFDVIKIIYIFFLFFQYIEYIVVLLFICCMIFLGFVDDVLELKWRYKLFLLIMVFLLLLMVYFVNFDFIVIIVFKFLRFYFGYDVNLGENVQYWIILFYRVQCIFIVLF